MRKFVTVALMVMSLGIAMEAMAKGNKPCSGKKGGIAKCTSDGKFMCKNGTISQSKYSCKK